MTYAESKNITYLKVLKIEKKEQQRSYSLYEDEEKKVLLENLKNAMLAQGVHNNIQKFDSVKVTIESEQKRLNVVKRGFKDTTIPMNPTDLVADEALTPKLLMGKAGDTESLTPTDIQTPMLLNESKAHTLTATNQSCASREDFQIVTVPEVHGNYVVFASKLVKFKDSKLEAVKFTQSGSRGKLLITFDQNYTVRFHKIRGLKTMQAFDFASYKGTDIDYQLTSQIETTRIELKQEPLSSPTPDQDMPETQTLSLAGRTTPRMQTRTICYYAGHIIAVYE